MVTVLHGAVAVDAEAHWDHAVWKYARNGSIRDIYLAPPTLSNVTEAIVYTSSLSP